jgi:hypothetical protein
MGAPFQRRRWAALGVAALVLAGCAAHPPRPSVVKQTGCADFAFAVYFRDGSDQLTTAAAQLIAGSVSRAKSCRVASLAITGAAGDAQADLTSRRSAAVAKALAANGLTSPAPQVGASQADAGLRMVQGSIMVTVRLTSP